MVNRLCRTECPAKLHIQIQKLGRQSEYEFAKRKSSCGRKQHTVAEFSVVLTEDVCGHIFVICGTV